MLGTVRRSAPSSTAQNVALARSHLTWLGILDDPWAKTMLRPKWALLDKVLRWPVAAGLGRNRAFAWLAARTRFFDDAVLAATGWTPRRTWTAPELVRHHVGGSILPTTGIRPTAFAVAATV
jgi:O-methyltransferase involved in polyketide biosynthesis